MLIWKTRILFALLAAAILPLAHPREADAFLFRWLQARRAERVAFFAPRPVVAGFVPTPQPACAVCPAPAIAAPCPPPALPAPCPQQVCTQVPEVSFRTVYRQVPVTVFRPVTSVDPCTGCPVTAMQPCTSVTFQAQRVPVTTYRQVCQLVQPACPAPVAVASPVQPALPAAPSCAPCAPAVPQLGVPAMPAPQLGPPMAAPAPTTSLAPVVPMAPMGPTPVPSHNGAPMTVPGTGAPAETPPVLPPGVPNHNPQGQVPFPQGNHGQYPQGQSPYPQTQGAGSTNFYRPASPAPALRPLPDFERSNQNAAPPLLRPDDQTAARGGASESGVVAISWEYAAPARPAAAEPARPAAKRLDDSGWRPAL